MKKCTRRALIALSLCLMLLLPACRFVRPGELTGGSGAGGASGAASSIDLAIQNVDGTGWKIAMITDTGGINDQSIAASPSRTWMGRGKPVVASTRFQSWSRQVVSLVCCTS